MELEVIAAAPVPREVMSARRGAPGPKPGAAFIARDSQGTLRACAGYLPCGICPRCQASLHLACAAPLRPGEGEVPGGAAGRLDLPGADLAPLAHGQDPAELVGPLALLALAGPTYQAAVLAGMVPGDTVLLPGPPPPDCLPVTLLEAMGLRPVLIGPGDQLPADLPSPRLHLMDLSPGEASLESWLSLAAGCISCTLVSPALPPLRPDLPALLAGQTTARWVSDVHPHLVLDIFALARELDLSRRAEPVSPEKLAEVLPDLDPLGAEPWPVSLFQ